MAAPIVAYDMPFLLRKTTYQERPTKRRASYTDTARPPYLHNIDLYVDVLCSDSTELDDLTTAVHQLLHYVSMEGVRPDQRVIETVVPRLLELLHDIFGEIPHFRVLVACTLSNIAFGQYAKVVFQAGAIPVLSGLLDEKNVKLQEMAAHCLANIAGHCIEYRNSCLETKIGLKICHLTKNPATKDLLQNSLQLVSNLVHGSPVVELNQVLQFVPLLTRVVANGSTYLDTHPDLVAEACGALAVFCEGIEQCVDQHSLGKIVKGLMTIMTSAERDSPVVAPALHALHCIMKQNKMKEPVVPVVVDDDGVIPSLLGFLEVQHSTDVRLHAAGCLSCIAAHGADYREMLLKDGIGPKICSITEQPMTKDLLQNLINLVSKLVGSPAAESSQVALFVPLLMRVISVCGNNPKLVAEAGGALAFFCERDEKGVNQVIQGKVVKDLLTILESAKRDGPVVAPALDKLHDIVRWIRWKELLVTFSISVIPMAVLLSVLLYSSMMEA